MRRLQYNIQITANDGYDIDVNNRSAKFLNDYQQQQYRKHSSSSSSSSIRKSKQRHHNKNSYLSNRNIYRNVVLPEGDWQWGGCGDNVMFGFRRSKEFLDSLYQQRSDIRTLVKLHNNNAGRLVS